MRYGSVCSGIEAATVAWHPLGWEPAFFSEIEKFPRAVLAHHYPDVPLHGDFTTIGENDYGTIQLLVGGTPCQSFSVAGLRKGLADERGNLALEYLKLAQRERPRWLVWENVPGVLSSNGGRDFGAFLGGLVQLGYGFAYRVLDAQYFGVAQRRRRVFVVGYLGDWRPAAAVLFERESLSGNPAPRRAAGEKPADRIVGSLAESSGHARPGDNIQSVDYLHPEVTHCPDVAKSIRGNSGGIDRKDMHTILPVLSSGQANAELTDNIAPALNCNRDGAPIAFQSNANTDDAVAAGNNVSPTVRGGGQGGNPPAIIQPYSIMPMNSGKDYKARPTDVAQPIMAGGPMGGNQGGDFIAHFLQVRRLTPVECERLQGFPDGYTAIPWRNKGPEDCPDGPRYKALGNSMAVPVMRWIGERIEAVDQILAEEKAIEIVSDMNLAARGEGC